MRHSTTSLTSSSPLVGTWALRAMLGALLLGMLPGCFVGPRGRALRADVARNDARLTEIEGRLEEAGARLQAQADELASILEEANVVLRRNSADQGLVIQRLQEQLGAIEGQIAETRNLVELVDRQATENRREMAENRREVDEERQQLARRLDQVERAAGMDVRLQPDQIPSDRDAHYRAAAQALRVGSHSDARALYRAFIERYPSDERADDAQYALGSSYLQQGQPAAALGEFRRILTTYRTGDMLDRTLFDMADAFMRVHACVDARASLEALIESQPRSALVTRARNRLREISRLPASACVE